MMKPSLIFGLVAFPVLACSPAPMPVAESLRDPSNPRAAAGVDSELQVATKAAAATHEHSAAEPAAGTVYTCPMHAEVTSDAPGVCPKCNMKLVPKK